MLDKIIDLYATNTKSSRVEADQQIREYASQFDIKELTNMLISPTSSLNEKTAAALAIGYHQDSDKTELRILFESLQKATGEPAKFAYRILSGIRKLLSSDVSLDNYYQFQDVIDHYKISGGRDTGTVASQIDAFINHVIETSDENKVFLVYGHDETLLSQAARFLEKLGLEVIVLREQPGKGQTIIEKLEHNSRVRFAVVLLTPDDLGKSQRDKNEPQPRARQNVIFELGYFIGKLGRRNVSVLYHESVELPSDYFGIEYIKIDDVNAWQFRLATELKAAGLTIDLNKIL